DRQPTGPDRLRARALLGTGRHEGGASPDGRHRPRPAAAGRQEMIRINLLPKEEKAQRPVSISFKAGDLVLPAMLLVATGLNIAGMALSQYSRATSLARSIADVDEQSRALAPQIERVNRLAQERAELDLRLGIIAKLEKGRAQSVRLMDDLARCVPDHLW